MIRPLVLGSKTFPTNLIQGPLAGVSCAPFRELVWQYSQPAFSCTEMISCKTLLHQPTLAERRLAVKSPKEGPVCFQLSSDSPSELGEAVKRATDLGADLIDLNCGCPVKKIRNKGAGSRLLTDPPKLFQLITAMKKNTPLPVSIKIRVEGASDERFHSEIANVVSDAGADFLIVHGRHWTEHYETPCRHEQIQFFVEALKIPVIGNGDVSDVASLMKMFETGCAGVMIGRAGVGQPWLIAQLLAEIQGKHFNRPVAIEIGNMFVKHIADLCQLLGHEKKAILQARKLAKYYARGLECRMAFCERMNQCDNFADFQITCTTFFSEESLCGVK